jgi:hypothetical protein
MPCIVKDLTAMQPDGQFLALDSPRSAVCPLAPRNLRFGTWARLESRMVFILGSGSRRLAGLITHAHDTVCQYHGAIVAPLTRSGYTGHSPGRAAELSLRGGP